MSESNPNAALGRRFLWFMKSKGYDNPGRASAAIGVHRQILYEIIWGKKDPRLSTLEKIVGKLGGTMAEFFAVPDDEIEDVEMTEDMDEAKAKKPPDDPQAVHMKLGRLLEARRNGRMDAEIAKKAEMSPQAFSRMMGGGVPDPRLSTLTAILRAIGATLCDYEKA